MDAQSYYAHVNIHSGHFFSSGAQLLYGDVDDEAMYAEVEGRRPESMAHFELTDDLRRAASTRCPTTPAATR